MDNYLKWNLNNRQLHLDNKPKYSYENMDLNMEIKSDNFPLCVYWEIPQMSSKNQQTKQFSKVKVKLGLKIFILR